MATTTPLIFASRGAGLLDAHKRKAKGSHESPNDFSVWYIRDWYHLGLISWGTERLCGDFQTPPALASLGPGPLCEVPHTET